MRSSEVSVIGLGLMGTALARALLAGGHRVTVWNRTRRKAESVAAAGADVASDATKAVTASPLVIMCLTDYAATDDVLRQPGVAQALAGRTLVQMTIGTQQQAREQSAWAAECGARFIAGGIMAFPSAIGQPNCMVLYGGDPSFAENRRIFESLGGALQYTGEDPAATIGVYNALVTFMLASMGGYLEAVAIARTCGFSASQFYGMARLAQDEIQRSIGDFTHRITNRQFEARESNLELVAASVAEICREIEQSGLPARMAPAFLDTVRLAIQCGHGARDMPVIAEALLEARDQRPLRGPIHRD